MVPLTVPWQGRPWAATDYSIYSTGGRAALNSFRRRAAAGEIVLPSGHRQFGGQGPSPGRRKMTTALLPVDIQNACFPGGRMELVGMTEDSAKAPGGGG